MSNTDELDLAFLRLQVELGGGEWVGIQEGFEDIEALVMFNEARSGRRRVQGSTMVIPVSQVTVERVHDHIVKKNQEFAEGRRRNAHGNSSQEVA